MQEIRLLKTYLNQKPEKGSAAISFAVIFLCALASFFYWQQSPELSLWNASGEKVFSEHQYWRLLSSLFVHSDLGHLLSNSYMLFILGLLTYGYFGFGVYPAMTLVAGILTNILTLLTYRPEVRLLGASGMVYFLAGFWLVMYVQIQRQYSWGSRWIRLLGIGLMILFPSAYEPNVSYRAHAIGLALGVLGAVFYFRTHKKRLRQAEVYKVTEVLSEDPEQ